MDPTERIVSPRSPRPLAAPVAAALSLLPLAGGAQQSGLDRLIHRTTLENGLEVVVAENRAVPLATVLVAVRNGSFTQDTLEAGLAHLYEHLLFHSFGRNPSAFGYEVSKDRKSTRLNSSHLVISYAVFCLKKKHTPQRQRGPPPSRQRPPPPPTRASWASCATHWRRATQHHAHPSASPAPSQVPFWTDVGQ